MDFTATNYTSYFQRPSTPNLNNVNMATVTLEGLTTALDDYDQAVAAYKGSYTSYRQRRDYILDLLQKDILCEAGLATKNLQTNKYTANIKANNYYKVANNDYDLTTEQGITEQHKRVCDLAKELFVLTEDDLDQLELSEQQINTYNQTIEGKMLPSATYDEKGKLLDISGIVGEQGKEIYFINEIANATGNDIQLGSYIYNDGTNMLRYVIKYLETRWVLIDQSMSVINGEDAIIATITLKADDILDNEPEDFTFTTFTSI